MQPRSERDDESAGTIERTTVDGGRLGRRSYLKMVGGAAATAASAMGVAGATEGEGGEDLEVIELEYDDCEHPSELYEQSGEKVHEFAPNAAYSGESALEIPWKKDDYRAGRSVYEFTTNGHDKPREVYSSCRVKLSEGFQMAEGDTLRMYVAGRHTGPSDSGGNPPSGDDGWTVLVGISARDADDGTARPDGSYTVFTYNYHMDQPSSSGEVLRNATFVEPGEWFSLETYVRLNTVSDGAANADGISRVWVDGELAVDVEDFRWDSTEQQGVEYVGPTGYWYSTQNWGAPREQSVYYDDHVLTLGGVLTRE
ncbi:polysaccharide lyase [Natrialbaceae archaeon A-gly3]